MGQWEDVPQDETGWENQDSDPEPTWEPEEDTTFAADPDTDTTPFGGVEQVDGLVYSDEIRSPELHWQHQQVDVPLPPVRERPQLPMHQRAEPWKPGPDPVPITATDHGRGFRLIFITFIPLLVLAGLGMLVYKVMQAYGL